MVTKRHNIASRILLIGVSKGPFGAGLASMDICSADRLALQNLQIPGLSTNRTLPKFIFPRRLPDKQRYFWCWLRMLHQHPLKAETPPTTQRTSTPEIETFTSLS
eukprot:589944-Pelagomonas_calceolata.AAC.1